MINRRSVTLATFVCALALAFATGGSAWAGGCPVCESSADCPGGFCVLHDSDVGCGGELMLCCPGQACGLGGDGRPSCESAGTCVVVDDGGGCGCAVVGAEHATRWAGFAAAGLLAMVAAILRRHARDGARHWPPGAARIGRGPR